LKFFRRLQTSSGIFGNDCVVSRNPSTPRVKISRLYLRKRWQVYCLDIERRKLMFITLCQGVVNINLDILDQFISEVSLVESSYNWK